MAEKPVLSLPLPTGFKPPGRHSHKCVGGLFLFRWTALSGKFGQIGKKIPE